MGIDQKHPVDIAQTCWLWLDHVTPELRNAMAAAWAKHGEPTTDPVRGAANLCEEVGEVASEALDATRKIFAPEGSLIWQRLMDQRQQSMAKMHVELMQVAGYAILLAVQLEGEIKEIVHGERS